MTKYHVLHFAYLSYVLGVLSWLAWRTKAQLESAAAASPGSPAMPSRERILLTTLISLLILFGMSWMVADLSGIVLFVRPVLGPREIVAGLIVLALHFVLRRIAVAMHTREELQKSLLVAWIPRTPREWVLYALVAIAAGVAEEAAYRGVAWTLLIRYTGSTWLSALVCAIAFGLAHAAQRWKSALIIFAIALLMHGFVAFLGSLVLAMVVHAVYDLIVGALISRRLDRQANSA